MYSFLVSILIGIGVVLPGVSGSAIAILVGIYDKVLIVLNDSGIKPSKKIIILFPVIIGIMVGVVIFGNILLKIYEYYEFQMKYIFIGLIFGGVPILVNELKDKGGVLKMKPLIFSVIFSLFFLLWIFPIRKNDRKDFSDKTHLCLFLQKHLLHRG